MHNLKKYWLSGVVGAGLIGGAQALNVLPSCQLITNANYSTQVKAYAQTSWLYLNSGYRHQALILGRNECISQRDPGVYTTTLVLQDDGNLVNYVYDEQNDINYRAFASDSNGLAVSYAIFYFDPEVPAGQVSLELVDANYHLLKQIQPQLLFKSAQPQLQGSLALSALIQGQNQSRISSLMIYTTLNGQAWSYVYPIQILDYMLIHFSQHSLALANGSYQITIKDQQSLESVSCQLPLTTNNCYARLYKLDRDHYILYLEESSQVTLLKYNPNHTVRAIYIDANKYIYSSWQAAANYNFSLTAASLQVNPAFTWQRQSLSASSLTFKQWQDSTPLPPGPYTTQCEPSSLSLREGQLSGNCLNLDMANPIWQYSSLDYDGQCTTDPEQDDAVIVVNGNLSCAAPS